MNSNQIEEYKHCKEGYNNMSGPEYFWYYYVKINGKSPKPGSWSEEAYEQWKKNEMTKRTLKARRIHNHNIAFKVIKETIFPLTAEEMFIKIIKKE